MFERRQDRLGEASVTDELETDTTFRKGCLELPQPRLIARPEAREGLRQFGWRPGLCGPSGRVLQLNVADRLSVRWFLTAEVKPDIDELVTHETIRSLLVHYRGALDRDGRQTGLDRQKLEGLTRCPGVVELIPVTTGANEVVGGHRPSPRMVTP